MIHTVVNEKAWHLFEIVLNKKAIGSIETLPVNELTSRVNIYTWPIFGEEALQIVRFIASQIMELFDNKPINTGKGGRRRMPEYDQLKEYIEGGMSKIEACSILKLGNYYDPVVRDKINKALERRK